MIIVLLVVLRPHFHGGVEDGDQLYAYAIAILAATLVRESFSDPEVAAVLNSGFICVIVDREERPELDRVYQAFVQASTGEGGWPLSVWLTPELKPFLGGTYFGTEDRMGQPSFRTMLGKVSGLWSGQRDDLVKSSNQMLAALGADLKATAAQGALDIAALRGRALAQAGDSFDAEHGGFEQAPKFPRPVLIDFLLDLSATSPDQARREAALKMALKTLRAMEAGGIHDQAGGGFHRYSVDARWRVPHFEKLLYDQAELASTYLTAWQVSGDASLRDTARDTLAYVRGRLTDPDGGFYSAEDADSAPARSATAPAEGAFYVWTKGEVDAAVGHRDADLVDYALGIDAGGNAAPEMPGRNILYRARTLPECAAMFGRSEADVRTAIDAAVARLHVARSDRPRPLRDEKIITAWNGLAISAFSRAYQVLREPADKAAAERAADFVRTHLFDPETGRLSRSYFEGRRDSRGFAEDYSFMIQGLLDLYETTFDVQWVEWAERLQVKQIELFLDPVAGGFFANTSDDPSVLLRMKDDSDGVEPSANSIAVRNLARLSAMLDRDDWRLLAERTARAFGEQMDRAPASLPKLVEALGWLEGSPQQILIQGEPQTPGTEALIGQVWSRFLPRHTLVRVDRTSRPYFGPKVPIIAELPADAGKAATAYVCKNFTCQLPTSDLATLAKLLTAGQPVKP